MNQQRRPVRQPPAPIKKKKRRRFPYWTLPVIALCVSLLVAAWVFADEQARVYDEFQAMQSTVSGDTFYGPVFLDSISLQGLTLEQAREAVFRERESQTGAFELYLTSGGTEWHIQPSDVPMAWNTEEQLQKLYRIGREGTLAQRAQQVKNLSRVDLFSEFTYDKAAVRTLTDRIAAGLTVPAEDAWVDAFDVANRTFTFTHEKTGQVVDTDALYQTVIDHFDRKQYGAIVTIPVNQVQPNVTYAQLVSNYKRIAMYTTNTTNDKNRNGNITIAASAINGKMISPGGTISFNESTGERTRAKGYLEAGAIENGRTVQEVAGGVCQVSSTLFNALVRADCEIVKRKPHAWPSTYVPRGEDATVDWPNLDLVMRNTSDAPMFVTAWYSDRTVTVEVYGLSLGDGVSIELESETTYSKKPTEVVNTYNPNLPIGTRQQLKKPQTGYSVTTYKLWLQDGGEVRREKFYDSEYRTIYEEYEYNDGYPPQGF